MAQLHMDHWHDRIRAAASQRDVVHAIQEYVAALRDAGRNCRGVLVLNDSSDVIEHALHLSHEELLLRPDTPDFELKREMASVFGDASLRIASIAITAGEPIEHSEGAWRTIPPAPWQRAASNASKY